MAEIKFVADVMVGKLARWLRVLGFDVLYSNQYDDDEVIRIADADRRVILTRDAGLARRGRRIQTPCLLIESGNYKEQIQQVLQSFNLKRFNAFSRCLECNTVLQEVDKEAVFEEVPPFVYLTQNRFAKCPSCNRVYWHGTHTTEMLKQIRP